MKVGLATYKFDIDAGGSNISLHLTAKYLCEKGHDVTVLIFDIGKRINPPIKRQYALATVDLEYDNKIDGARAILKKINNIEFSFDVYHVFDPGLIPLFGMYRKKGGDTPVVGRLNNYGLFCSNENVMNSVCYKNCSVYTKYIHSKSTGMQNLNKIPKFTFDTHISPYFVNSIDRLLPISPTVSEVYIQNGISKENLTVIPNFYEKEFDSTNSGHLELAGSPALLYVGRLTKEKGVDIAISAMSEFDDNAVLHIVGDGPERGKLYELANNSNMSSKIKFYGWVDHQKISSYYKNSDYFIHPAKWPEPFGRTIIEAIQHDCIPIVSDAGAPSYIVNDKELVFVSGSVKELYETVKNMIDKDGNRKKKHVALRKHLDNFSPKNVINDLEQVYTELFNK